MKIDGLDHLVLTVRDLEATCAEEPLEAVIAHIRSRGVEIIAGPLQRTGARGPLRSIYLRDPDDSLIEIANAA